MKSRGLFLSIVVCGVVSSACTERFIAGSAGDMAGVSSDGGQPESQCVDANTARAFGPAVCTSGVCTYAHQDETCAHGCVGGACKRDKVDILFMVDDSGSTSPKQARLRAAFPMLASALQRAGSTTPVSYHIGVVTSDLGMPGANCGHNKGAKLQAKGAAAPENCLGPKGSNFLIYDQTDPTKTNIPEGQDLASTFTCMGSVGDKGCGFEMPMEAVYRALHDDIAENQGFLRPDALLAIVFVTDEDDCSVDDPQSILMAGSNEIYGAPNSYRCTRFGITCDGQFPLPATPQATFASCAPATKAQGSLLADMDKYIRFFTQSGGVKANVKDVILTAIDAPSSPVGTGTADGQAFCGDVGNAPQSCTVLNHSCSLDSTFFADPAVRLNALLAASPNSSTVSICSDDSVYAGTLDALGKKITLAL